MEVRPTLGCADTHKLYIYPKGCAATRERACLVQRMKAPEIDENNTSPQHINVASKSPVGDISVVALTRTDTTIDQSPKSEKVCLVHSGGRRHIMFRQHLVLLVSSV